MAGLNETPGGERLHIGFFGRRNSGKSSLVNALTGHSTALVSDVAGTTTDPVYKSMEIHGIGPCSIIDTAGYDDEGDLGSLRVERTSDAAKKTDVAVLVLGPDDISDDMAEKWAAWFKKHRIPVVLVMNKADTAQDAEKAAARISEHIGVEAIVMSARTGEGVDELKRAIIRAVPEDWGGRSVTGRLASEGMNVMLVMPQDIQAPKGRLILPQVQTIRDLLDKHCIVTAVTTDKIDAALELLSSPPDLIITDSQAFRTVAAKKPTESLLTSFSVLFAVLKGDKEYFRDSAMKLPHLPHDAKILIAEACTHAPLPEDIGREKIPRLLRKHLGDDISVQVVSGPDFPDNLADYDMIIHCGACMFNRRYVLSRVEEARAAGVPMTNYGMTIASLIGILDDVAMP